MTKNEKETKILSLYYPQTIQPSLEILPRYILYVHSTTATPTYCSLGKNRLKENHCIFHYTLRGEGVCYNRYGQARVRAGQGFLSVVHDPFSGYEYPEDGKEVWEFLCFGFDFGNSTELVYDLLEKHGQVFTLDIHTPVLQKMISLSLTDENPLLTAHESAAFFYELYSELVKSIESERRGQVRVHPVIEKIKQTILSHIEEDIDVSFLAREVGYSREYLSRLFHRETGFSLKAHIDGERLKHACFLLKETTLSVREISEKLRYTSQSNFSRTFKSRFGISPLVFRNGGNAFPL